MLALSLSLVLAAGVPSVAAPPWKTANVDAKLADFFAEQLASSLRARGLKVITAGDIGALLGMERERQLLGCTDSNSCLAEIGSALGCEGTLLVSAARFGETWRATLRIVGSDALPRAETRLEVKGDQAFGDALDRAAEELAAPLLGKKSASAPPPNLTWLPATVGGVAAATGLGAAIFAGVQLEKTRQATTLEQAQQEAAPGLTARTVAWVALGVAGAAAVTTVIVAVTQRAPAASVGVVPSANGAQAFISWELP
ncbi:MAG: hypothetical protein ACOZQL_30395 [Myxococcota bacterium]